MDLASSTGPSEAREEGDSMELDARLNDLESGNYNNEWEQGSRDNKVHSQASRAKLNRHSPVFRPKSLRGQ